MTEPQTSKTSGSRLPGQALIAGLFLITVLISATAWQTGAASALEAVAFVTGVFCVWLVTRQNIWNFPLGLITVGIYAWIFYQSQLFATAGLQLVFFTLNLIGWYLWLYGGEGRTALSVGRISKLEILLTLAGIAGLTTLLWHILEAAGGAAKFLDALTASISIAAQWLQSRKKLECWLLWLTANILYIPLCFFNGLPLAAMLYAVYLVLAIMGLLEWRKAERS